MILPEIVSSQIYNGKQWKRLATVDTFRDLLCDLRWQWWKWRTTRAAWREMIKRYHPALYTGSTACTKHDYNSKCIHWKSHNMAHCSPQYFKPKADMHSEYGGYCILHTLSHSHCGSCPLCKTSGSLQKSALSSHSRSQSCCPQAGAYTCASCLTTNLYAWGSPPTELISPSYPSCAASPTSSPLLALTQDWYMHLALQWFSAH